MDHVYAPTHAEGSKVEEDVFMVPFNEEGFPSEEKTVWDLRLRRKVKLTGGPYIGDMGTIVSKDEAGHYLVSLKDTVPPQFRDKPLKLKMKLGNWFIEEATNGHGICPGGPIPFVNVRNAD